jgi:hypothetical protein
MLALPFLSTEVPSVTFAGHGEGIVESVSVAGHVSRHPATLAVEHGRGELAIKTTPQTLGRYPLVGISGRGTYDLIRPDGIFFSTIDVAGDQWNLRAVGYGSPQVASPATNPPFLTYRDSGTFIRSSN